MWTRANDRSCYVTPCFPGDPTLAGNERLLDREEALPLWSAISLWPSYYDLATRIILRERLRGRRGKSELRIADEPGLFDFPEDRELASFVASFSKERGGAQVQQLLDWAVSRGWSPEKFFHSLRRNVVFGKIIDEQGILTAGRVGIDA